MPKGEEEKGNDKTDLANALGEEYRLEDWVKRNPYQGVKEDKKTDRLLGELRKGEGYWESGKYENREKERKDQKVWRN